MKKTVLSVQLIILTTISMLSGYGYAQSIPQTSYWVFLKDKRGSNFNPYAYFSSHTIERRLQWNECLEDSTDFAVSNDYLQALQCYSDTILFASRWFNAVALQTKEIDVIAQLPFVKYYRPIIYTTQKSVCQILTLEHINFTRFTELAEKQLERMGGNAFKAQNLTGKGVRIAIFDAGFSGVDKHEAFSHIRKAKRIIKTYDFVRQKNDVFNYDTHGAMAFSAIAGITENTPLGLATEAEFLLARTELSDEEPFSEELNWLAAAEWADKHGADIINSSLGYTDDRYQYKNMNGTDVFVTRAANMAVAKGMLVVNAAGNEGSDAWKYVAAPADGDSVLAVGGIDPSTNLRIYFSSIGPTYDRRMKPNVSAFGLVSVCGGKHCTMGPGTSFACPLVSGFAACVKQLYPNMKPMELFRLIEKSGDLYPYFDYNLGFGVPTAQRALDTLLIHKPLTPTFELIERNDTFFVKLKDFSDTNLQQHFRYHIQSVKGDLDIYETLPVRKIENFFIDRKRYQNQAATLRVFFNGYMQTVSL